MSVNAEKRARSSCWCKKVSQVSHGDHGAQVEIPEQMKCIACIANNGPVEGVDPSEFPGNVCLATLNLCLDFSTEVVYGSLCQEHLESLEKRRRELREEMESTAS